MFKDEMRWELKSTRQVCQFSNSDWRLANTLHVGVTSVELRVCRVPRSGALSVRVGAQRAETSVGVSEGSFVFPIDAHVAVVHENRSASCVWVIVSERAGLGESLEAVYHLISISLAPAIVHPWFTLVGVPVRGPVCADWEFDILRVVIITDHALGAAFVALVKRRSHLISENKLLSE